MGIWNAEYRRITFRGALVAVISGGRSLQRWGFFILGGWIVVSRSGLWSLTRLPVCLVFIFGWWGCGWSRSSLLRFFGGRGFIRFLLWLTIGVLWLKTRCFLLWPFLLWSFFRFKRARFAFCWWLRSCLLRFFRSFAAFVWGLSSWLLLTKFLAIFVWVGFIVRISSLSCWVRRVNTILWSFGWAIFPFLASLWQLESPSSLFWHSLSSPSR